MTVRVPDPLVCVPPARRAWSVTRAIALALLVGLATTATLTLVVLAGATESVVTGGLLVGAGAGWGTLAAASRRTGCPQEWARVPTVAMAGAGTALLVLRPGDAAMTALTWGWPPLLLVLAVWAWLKAGRDLPLPPRLFLTPVLVVLVATAAGGVAQAVHDHQVWRAHAAPGTTYDVGGHRLHLDCRGEGGPTVVLLNGLGEFSGSWARVVEEVAGTTRVCAYDRAGQGWSDDVDRPQDGLAAVADLHALLAAAGEPGPYVLAGHSTGGLYALTYAHEYPDTVAGVVLLDSTSPRQLTAMPDYSLQHAVMRRALALWPTVARIGLGSATTVGSHLPGLAGRTADALSSTVRAKRNGRDEVSVIPRLLDQADALTDLGDRPLAVVTASENLTTRGWPEEQRRLAGLSSDSDHTVASSTHAGLLEDTAGARASAAAITAVVRAVASGTRLATAHP